MGSDPEDHDAEAAALRARLDRLSADLKGRIAPPSTPKPKSPPNADAATGSAMSLGLRAGSELISAVILGLGDRVGARPGARDQSGIPDRIFPAWGGGRGVERDPADFAERRVIE